MTDDEKLELLEKQEAEGWRLLDLQVESVARIKCLEIIERCQRIRANLQPRPQYDGFTRKEHVMAHASMPGAVCYLPNCPDHPIIVYSDDGERRYHPSIDRGDSPA